MKETLKTTILFSLLTGLLVGFGALIGGPEAIIPMLIFSILINIGSYWFSDRIALSMAGGKEVSRESMPELYADTEQLAKRMDMPMPRLYVSDNIQPNAFATGRSPKNGVVCVTKGLLESLEREEIKGVIAHELVHIKNRDVLTATIAAVIAGVISTLANFFLFFGGGDEDAPNPLFALAMMILAPLLATIIQLAISRSREYAADKGAANATGNPRALADALIKIEEIATRRPMQVNQGMQSLYIGNPMGKAGNILSKLFSTHPPTAERVKALVG